MDKRLFKIFIIFIIFISFLISKKVFAYDSTLIDLWNFDSNYYSQILNKNWGTVASTNYNQVWTGGRSINQNYNNDTAITYSSIPINDGVSVCFWIKVHDGTTGDSREMLQLYSNDFGYLWRNTFNHFSIYSFWTDGGQYPTGSGGCGSQTNTTVPIYNNNQYYDGNYHFICEVLDENEFKLYADNGNPYHCYFNNQIDLTGKHLDYFNSESQNYDLALDDVSIWDHALTDSEIFLIYEYGKGIDNDFILASGQTNGINIINPRNNQTINLNLGTMAITGEYVLATTTETFLSILIQNSDKSYYHRFGGDSVAYYSSLWGASKYSLGVTRPLLPDGIYTATAELYTGEYPYINFLATSTSVNFRISATSTDEDWYFNYLASGTLPECDYEEVYNNACNNIATSTLLGEIECGIVHVGIYLFYPRCDNIKDLINSTQKIKTRFPLNTFFDLQTIVNEQLATSTNSNNTLGIPFIRKTGTTTQYYILPVLASSSMPKTIGQSNTNMFRTGLTWFFWIVTMVICFLFIKIIL
jgi:hypothetical protein